MTHADLIALLPSHTCTITDGVLIVSGGGNVYLSNLTTLPAGVTFKNKGYVNLSNLTTLPAGVTFSNGANVYLSSLTTLPEGVTFSNRAHVNLSSLTTLPAGVTFSNRGGVNLSSLTTLPEGVTFSNGGYVNLYSLTTLPEGVAFSNGGYVNLYSLTSETQTYQGRTIRLRRVDGYTMRILSERTLLDGTRLARAEYFQGSKAAPQKCYIASDGAHSAHGATADEALTDLRFKLADHGDKAELVATIKARGTVTFQDFRYLTGACSEGLRHGMEEAGLDPAATELPFDTVMAAVHGGFGDTFKTMMEGV